MSIFKRGKVYCFHFWFNGKHIQRTTKQGNKTVARQIEAAYRTALAKGEVGIMENKKMPGFASAMDSFLEWSETEHSGQRAATYKRYRVSSVALLKYFKNMPLDKITAEEVEQFKKTRGLQFATKRGKNKRVPTNKRIKPATVNRELACLRAAFNHTIKTGLLIKNPVSITGAKALPENSEKNRVLTYEEQEKYLAHASPMLFGVASIILETGMRPEEVCRIRPENVHLDRDYLFNPYGKTKAAKRRIKLTSAARRILAARMVACKGAYLFSHKDDLNRPVPKVNNAHDSALKASGLKHFVIYDCRHTWATRAVEAGVDLVTLAAMMGHTRIQMVMRYAHPSQDHQSKAMDIVESHVAAERIALAEKNQLLASQAIQ